MSGSVYVHIPFCNKKCPYCHFYVLPNTSEGREKLLPSLRLEWELRKPSFSLESIYFGGGTPALFGPEAIAEVLSWMDPGDIEITLEANPEDITLELMAAYKEAGINRISIGVQSLDDTLLKTIGRSHTAQEAIDAIGATHEAGFTNISIDLMLDLPSQSLSQVENTFSQAVDLPITHLSLYNLVLEPPSLFYSKRNQIAPQMPKEELSLTMLQTALAYLAPTFERYEVSAFARDGLISHHNVGYWTGRPFLGLGPSAFSYLDSQRTRNVAHLNQYMRALERGTLPIDYTDDLDKEARERELAAVGLRLLEGIDEPLFPEIAHLIDDGLLERNNKRLRLTEKGLLFYDSVATALI